MAAKPPPADEYDYAYAVELARSKSTKALRKLAELMDSDDERVAYMACTALLDRAWGKAAQVVHVDGQINHNHVTEFSEQQLEAIAAGSSAGAAKAPARAH